MEKVEYIVDIKKNRCTAMVGNKVFARYKNIPDFVMYQQDGWREKNERVSCNRIK